MTRADAITQARKLRDWRDRPGAGPEGKAAGRALDRLVVTYEITAGDLDEARELEDAIAGAGAEPIRQRPPDIDAAAAVLEQPLYPGRVHLARDHMRSVCGVGPSFVWTFRRDIAIASGQPCPYCLETRVIDARCPERLAP